jgi:hypothetical protein
MADRALLFEVYRLNIVDDDDLSFEFMGQKIRTDSEVARVLEQVTKNDFDLIQESGRATYSWAAREFVNIDSLEADGQNIVYSLSLGRSTLQQRGQTVTDQSIEEALTTFYPPSAEIIHLLFYMKRHLVVVEYNSSLMQTQAWRNSIHSMLARAARSLDFLSEIRLEPIPRDEEILNAFRSFDRLTRLRVRLRIPNPEMDRRTERLRQDMLRGEIREYTQDMKNPAGLSKLEDGLPFATAAMAQAGYKDGEVIMTGIRNARRLTVRTGKIAVRGKLDGLKDYIRGIGVTARTAEGRRVVRSILEEVDRLAEVPSQPLLDSALGRSDDGEGRKS